MEKQELTKVVEELDKKMINVKSAIKAKRPQNGWIREIRQSINMPAICLGERIEKPISAQAIIELEKSEINGTINLNSLKRIADALDLELVYGFVHKEKTFYQRIYSKCGVIAHDKFHKAPHLYKEKSNDIGNNYSIAVLTRKIFNNLPKSFWKKNKST